MSIFKELKAALEETGLPVYRDFYDGDKTAYIVINIFDERPAVCGDGDDEVFSVMLDVDLWCRSDPTEYKKKIRKILRKQNYAIQSINNFYEDKVDYYHTVFRCEIEREADD